VHREDRAAAIVRSREHQLELELGQIRSDPLRIPVDLFDQLFLCLIFSDQSQELEGVPRAALELTPYGHVLSQGSEFLHRPLGLGLIAPERRIGRPFLQLDDLVLLVRQSKPLLNAQDSPQFFLQMTL
jgi:hypothetical protein